MFWRAGTNQKGVLGLGPKPASKHIPTLPEAVAVVYARSYVDTMSFGPSMVTLLLVAWVLG